MSCVPAFWHVCSRRYFARAAAHFFSGHPVLFTSKYCQDYEDTRQCLESCDLDEGLQQFITQHKTGSEGPPPVTCQSLPNSSTLGMGHMAQQRQLTSHAPQDKQYDTHSLGRTTPGAVVGTHHTHNTQSLTTLSEIGRSRSDLGYTTARQDINQSHRSSHTAQPTHDKPPTTHPRKPPRYQPVTQIFPHSPANP